MPARPGPTVAWSPRRAESSSGFMPDNWWRFDPDGHLMRVVSREFTEGHGITLVREGDAEYLWVADPGFVFASTSEDGDAGLATIFGKGLRQETRRPRVVTLGGELRRAPVAAQRPTQAPGMMGPYCPTSVAVDEERLGGSGDVWAADGYGASLVHRFDQGSTARVDAER